MFRAGKKKISSSGSNFKYLFLPFCPFRWREKMWVRYCFFGWPNIYLFEQIWRKKSGNTEKWVGPISDHGNWTCSRKWKIDSRISCFIEDGTALSSLTLYLGTCNVRVKRDWLLLSICFARFLPIFHSEIWVSTWSEIHFVPDWVEYTFFCELQFSIPCLAGEGMTWPVLDDRSRTATS